MLNSTEHEFFLLMNIKMPTIVGILTFMSGKNSILGLSDHKKAEFIYLLAFKISCSAELSLKKFYKLGPWFGVFHSYSHILKAWK